MPVNETRIKNGKKGNWVLGIKENHRGHRGTRFRKGDPKKMKKVWLGEEILQCCFSGNPKLEISICWLVS